MQAKEFICVAGRNCPSISSRSSRSRSSSYSYTNSPTKPPAKFTNFRLYSTDSRKLQSRLLTNWKYIPIEVAPIAAFRVLRKLTELGSINPTIRSNSNPKEGNLKTDQDFFLIDAPFPPMLIQADLDGGLKGTGTGGVWEVARLAREIKQIAGVLEVGIFSGQTGPQATAAGGVGGQRPVAAYFGMPDGSVSVRNAIQ
ncbi:Ribose-5-phosphate isomerase [Penicillium cosmopolitanum]|uniref:Ribose-5-phosphate isomerase n=1 Tax=Penicillium cosmopolitanum TaxID=1131564 RepID=A0A9X0B5H1_9EURO|nr:Ribose-5-phosphate isomerase [Penicillium cosmopolitanum]KAJ5388747.1 Ribose-5-phosphate isomerase [Penicillium cosmopolitanum]